MQNATFVTMQFVVGLYEIAAADTKWALDHATVADISSLQHSTKICHFEANEMVICGERLWATGWRHLSLHLTPVTP